MKRKSLYLTLLLLMASVAYAETGVVGSSEALALKYKGAWSAGTHITQSYDFMDFGAQKTTHLFVQAHQILAPTPGKSIYAAGVTLQPDLSKYMAKTNLSPSSFQLSMTGAVGNSINAGTPNKLAWIAGVNAGYRLASNLQWQSLSFIYGKDGSRSFYGVSSGLSFFFGPARQAFPAPSAQSAPSRPAMP